MLEKLTLLRELKLNYEANHAAISELELVLDRIAESDLISELEKYSLFDHINQEKITPFFLKLAKSNTSTAKMSAITDRQGLQFTSEPERKTFITNFYAEIYKLPPGEQAWEDGSIENFLGPEVCNHPVVTDSKISADTKILLDAPLSLIELDAAVDASRVRGRMVLTTPF